MMALETARLAGFGHCDVMPELCEWDYGDFEGLTTAAIRARGPEWAHWTVWTGPVPNGETLEPYEQAVARQITPLTVTGWGVKRAFDRFPRTTFALLRFPPTWRVVERVLTGELAHPSAARGLERTAVRAVDAVARVAS